jgi:hypothetical protein
MQLICNSCHSFATRRYLSSAKQIHAFSALFLGKSASGRLIHQISHMLCVLYQHINQSLKEFSMSALISLKLVATKKPANISPIVIRRNKLSAKLWDQIQLAQSQAAGQHFQPTRLRTVRDVETGLNKTIEVPKRIKPWWWASETGKVCVAVRYGSKVLELTKGKAAIEVTDAQDLIRALEAVKVAVLAGELDAQIEAASGALRSGFKR